MSEAIMWTMLGSMWALGVFALLSLKHYALIAIRGAQCCHCASEKDDYEEDEGVG